MAQKGWEKQKPNKTKPFGDVATDTKKSNQMQANEANEGFGNKDSGTGQGECEVQRLKVNAESSKGGTGANSQYRTKGS